MAESNNFPIVGLFTGAQMLHDPFRPHVISVRASYYDAGPDLTRSKFITALESFHNKDIGLGADFKLNYGPKDHKGFDKVCYTVVTNRKPMMIKDWKGQVASLIKK